MITLTKDNINEFMNYYHYLHDSSINKINYNSIEAKVEVIIDIYWSGEPIIKSDGTYDTYKCRIRIVFTGVDKFSENQYYCMIDDSSVEYYDKDGKNFICISLLSYYLDEYTYYHIAHNKHLRQTFDLSIFRCRV